MHYTSCNAVYSVGFVYVIRCDGMTVDDRKSPLQSREGHHAGTSVLTVRWISCKWRHKCGLLSHYCHAILNATGYIRRLSRRVLLLRHIPLRGACDESVKVPELNHTRLCKTGHKRRPAGHHSIVQLMTSNKYQREPLYRLLSPTSREI